MRKNSLFHRFLIKIGFIKEASGITQTKVKKKMCKKAINSGICPNCCDTCAWNI